MGEQRPPIGLKTPIPSVMGNINKRATDIRTNQLNNTIPIHVEEGLRLKIKPTLETSEATLQIIWTKLQKDERKKGKKYS